MKKESFLSRNILIIALIIICISLVVMPVIPKDKNDSEEGIELEVLTDELEVLNNEINISNNLINFIVKRTSEKENMTGIKIQLENSSGGVYTYEENVILGINEEYNISINIEEKISDVNKITIVMMYKGYSEDEGEENNESGSQSGGGGSGGGGSGVDGSSSPTTGGVVNPPPDDLDFYAKPGEEVVFDALEIIQTTGESWNYEWEYEWQFGDGTGVYEHTLPASEDPYYYVHEGGTAVSHFYLEEGVYEGNLTIEKESEKIVFPLVVNVAGEKYSDKFELWHADFNSRTGQWIYVRLGNNESKLHNDPREDIDYDEDITLDIGNHADYRMLAKISRDEGGYNEVLFNENRALEMTERFLLNNSKLPAGNYTLNVTIIIPQEENEQILEYFEKPYNGLPKWGINENNAFVDSRDGTPELFFPVTPFSLDEPYDSAGKISSWDSREYLNSLHSEGWWPGTHTIESFQHYLDKALLYDLPLMGPGRGDWANVPDKAYWRNANVSNLEYYVSSKKEHEGLLAWFWTDEPDEGGWGAFTPTQVLRAWTKKSKDIDSQHPVVVNLLGPDYLKWSGFNRQKSYSYLYNKDNFGKKTSVFDVYGFDYYPIDWSSNPASMTIYNLSLGLDRLRDWNYNLVPYMSFIETCDINDAPNTSPPTKEQVKMLIWLNIVHGVKGINYFHYFGAYCHDYENNPSFEAMEEFSQDLEELKEIVLLEEPSRIIIRIDTENNFGNRVDTMIKENEKEIWIFAVRVTEVISGEVNIGLEQEVRNATFKISGISNEEIQVYNEDRIINVNSNGEFTDSFDFNDVHIYKIIK